MRVTVLAAGGCDVKSRYSLDRGVADPIGKDIGRIIVMRIVPAHPGARNSNSKPGLMVPPSLGESLHDFPAQPKT